MRKRRSSAKPRVRRLRTAKQVVKVLGGTHALCELTGANARQAWNWIGRFGAFPASCHWLMTKELKRKKCEAPPRLWNQRGEGGRAA